MPALATSPNTSSPADAALPYTHGLTGVDIPLDTKLSHAWWATVGGICLAVFLARLVQKAVAYIRHLLNLSGSEQQQRYWATDKSYWWPWLKKNLLYAPFWKKRHNREKQLSSAVNIGTLPSRFHMVLLCILIVSNAVYCLLLNWKSSIQAEILAELRGRTGNLATLLIAPLVLLAGRNNLLIPLLGVSFDTFNLFHRWIGRLVVANAIIHTFAWAANTAVAKGESGLWRTLLHDRFLIAGMAGTVAMCLMFVHSPSPIRHAFYEVFKQCHILLAWVALIGIWAHCRDAGLPQKSWMDLTLIIWAIEHTLRWGRIWYHNFDRRGVTKWTQATVEVLPENACRVAFEVKRPWTFRPGCHVYVRFPSVSQHMAHPFSVAWVEERPAPYASLEVGELPLTEKALGAPDDGRKITMVYCVIRKQTGMTKKLHDKALAEPTRILNLTGVLEGPYGGLESLHSYGTAILFAGGVGITHQLGMVRHLLDGFNAGTVATRRVILVWSIRREEQMEWVQKWFNQILYTEHRREFLKVEIYVSKPRENQIITSRSQTVRMFPGRCRPEEILAREIPERIGTTAVTVCGPGAFADDVRAATRAQIYNGAIDFVEESFTW